ncbi:MAG: endonuclease domain-containing protein [Tabrizicola sp.]
MKRFITKGLIFRPPSPFPAHKRRGNASSVGMGGTAGSVASRPLGREREGGGLCEVSRQMTRIAPPNHAPARTVRKCMTPQERRLWAALQEVNRKSAMRFRRQAPIGPCIADFAEPGCRLAIEADGGERGRPQDRERDGWFVAQGVTVPRFRNAEVDGNLAGVTGVVVEALMTCPPPPPPSPEGKGRRRVPAGRETRP